MGSTEKPLLILKRLGEPPYGLNLAEIAECVGIGKSGAHKVIQVLKEHHFVVQDDFSKKYYLSPLMLRLGNVYSKCRGIESVIKPVLEKISNTIDETSYVTVWEGDGAFPAYMHTVTDGVYSSRDYIGQSLPINSGASSMLLCAYQEPKHIEKLLDTKPLEKRTPLTLTDKELIVREFEIIRKQGYCVEDETFNLGEMSLAVPVFDKQKGVFLALACAAPKKHLTEERIQEWLHLLKNEADEISRDIQFRH